MRNHREKGEKREGLSSKKLLNIERQLSISFTVSFSFLISKQVIKDEETKYEKYLNMNNRKGKILTGIDSGDKYCNRDCLREFFHSNGNGKPTKTVTHQNHLLLWRKRGMHSIKGS